MPPAPSQPLTPHLPQVIALCQRHGVVGLWAFGSAVASGGSSERFDAGPERSDIDLLVQFKDMPVGALADAYFDLREALQALLGRRVDLVTVASMTNPFFRASVERTRVPLYAAA